MDFVNEGSEKSEITLKRFVTWLGIAKSKFYDWRERYGKVNEHNGKIPRDFWLEEWEKRAIVEFHREHPDEGYRRLTFMMLDANVAATGPTSVWRVLRGAGLLKRWNGKLSKKGTGFVQPVAPHEHWHIDVSYINICGTFYYLCSVLDGCSRFIVHWDIRMSMTEAEIEIILERAKEKFPQARPRIISDNGPQFIAKDFKEFIRISGMTHVRTSPYYPQSKGRVERHGGVLQDRLVKELRRLGISGIAEANAMLDGFTERLDAKFAIEPASPVDRHRKAPPREALDEILCWEVQRTVARDWTVSYEGRRYQILRQKHQPRPGNRVTVRKPLDGAVKILWGGQSLAYRLFGSAEHNHLVGSPPPPPGGLGGFFQDGPHPLRERSWLTLEEGG